MNPLLDSVIIEPAEKATASIIWLHGLGANGHDFEPIVPQLKLSPELAIRFIFPHAPSRPVTLNQGMVMPAWFDILGLDRQSQVDEQGIQETCQQIHQLIHHEKQQGIPASRIILGGFSQGGVIALQSAFTYPESLAGAFGLSTYLPHPNQFNIHDHAAQENTRLFLAHGTYDPVLPYELGESSFQALHQNQFQVEWHSYPMAHEVCLEEIKALSEWITDSFK